MRHTLILFYSNDLNKLYIQDTNIEPCDRFRDQDPKGKNQVNILIKKDDKKEKGHCSHCNVDSHVDGKCWKIHIEEAPKWFEKNQEKKNALGSKSNEPCVVEDAFDFDEKLTCMGVKNSKELYEEDKQIQLFHIKFQEKKTWIDVLFDPRSQVDLIVDNLVKILDLKTQYHTHPYPLGWMHMNAYM